MVRNQGQRLSRAPTAQMNNMAVPRQQQVNTALAQTHQTPSPIFYVTQPVQFASYGNNQHYINKHGVSMGNGLLKMRKSRRKN